jgi:GT2 family glycosyltransferase
MSIEVSVIIVSWNCRQMLTECLRSIQSGLVSDKSEIIVIDNASSDGTVEAIRKEFPSVNMIACADNLGFAQGNNIGIDVSSGEYLCLINPDVVVESGCIETLVKYLSKHPDLGMVAPQIIGSDRIVQRSCMRTPTLWNQLCRALALDCVIKKSRLFGGYLMKDFDHDTTREVDIVNGCFWVVRRDALDDVGLIDPLFWMYADDLDWCHRFHAAGWKIMFHPEARAIHFGGGSSRNTPITSYLQMHRADLQYWRKYHNLLSFCAYWLILLCAQALRSVGYGLIYVLQSSRRNTVLPALKRHVACLQWLAAGAGRLAQQD